MSRMTVRTKLDALTGLRFIAASLIVAEHARMLQIPVPNYAWDFGVSFFFVLSGFILTYVYPALESRKSIFRFYVARIARIWPAHLVALALVVVLFKFPLDRTLLAANILLLQGWVPSLPWYFSYNAVSWTISAEWFFYIVFPVLIFRWKLSWWWKWALSALIVFALIELGTLLHLPNFSQEDEATLHGLLYANPLARLFEFTTGMVTCLAYRRLQPLFSRLPDMLFTLLEILVAGMAWYSIASGSVVIFLRPYFQGAGLQWLGHAGDVFVFPFVIFIFAFGRGYLSRALSISPMVLLGEISYSVYLLHMIVFRLYGEWHPNHVGPDYLGLVICITATLAFAYIMWSMIETSCRNAARRWSRSLLLEPNH